jgi:hypothetical protein
MTGNRPSRRGQKDVEQPGCQLKGDGQGNRPSPLKSMEKVAMV